MILASEKGDVLRQSPKHRGRPIISIVPKDGTASQAFRESRTEQKSTESLARCGTTRPKTTFYGSKTSIATPNPEKKKKNNNSMVRQKGLPHVPGSNTRHDNSIVLCQAAVEFWSPPSGHFMLLSDLFLRRAVQHHEMRQRLWMASVHITRFMTD